MTRRVAITGIGTLNPLATNTEDYWKALAEGRSGISAFDRFDNSTMSVRFGGAVADFDPLPYFKDAKMAKRFDRCIVLGHCAGVQAFRDSGLDENLDRERAGVVVGTGMGGTGTFEADVRTLVGRGHKRVSPFFVPFTIPNTVAASIALDLGMLGPNFVTVTACASANHAMGEAMEIIRRGECDVMVAGGSESAMNEITFAGFANMKALSTRNEEPTKASRPFDKGRDGFVMAEGSAMLVLEEMEHAKKRGARIYCELAGFGQSCDAYHITAPDPEGNGGLRAMRKALASAEMNPQDVDLVNAHGTSTPLGDAAETLAIKRCFGDHARKLKVHSTKSMIGHCLGAAGAVEAAADIQSLVRGLVHATLNQEEPDERCDLDYVPNQAIEMPVRAFLSNSFGFGGHNASLIFRRVD